MLLRHRLLLFLIAISIAHIWNLIDAVRYGSIDDVNGFLNEDSVKSRDEVGFFRKSLLRMSTLVDRIMWMCFYRTIERPYIGQRRMETKRWLVFCWQWGLRLIVRTGLVSARKPSFGMWHSLIGWFALVDEGHTLTLCRRVWGCWGSSAFAG